MLIRNLPPGFQFLVSSRVPPELVLQIIQHLPFEDGKIISSLCANSRVQSLIHRYEHSITSSFMKRELRHALADFPYDGRFDLDWLSHCVSRYDVVDAIMDELTWRENCVAVEPHNVSLVNVGLLLLYRLASMEHHDDKLKLIRSLARDPLIAIYTAVHHAKLTGRYHGHGWIHQHTYGRFMDANQLSLRNEMEFCFVEATLGVGPEFLYDMLVNPSEPSGEITLLNVYHDHGTHDWNQSPWSDITYFGPPGTQGPQRETGSQGRSLYTTMLESLASEEGCPLEEIKSRTEQYTSPRDHDLAFLSLGGKARLIRGLNMD